MKRIIVSAPGRVCLFGEHMDWCGYHVLACAVDMRVFIEAESTNNNSVEAYSHHPFTEYDRFNLGNIDVNRNSDLKYVGGVLKAFQKKELPYSLGGMNLYFLKAEEVQRQLGHRDLKNPLTDLPAKKGLSSSAAMCVATSSALDLIHRFKEMGLRDAASLKKYISESEILTFYADLAYIGERKELGINCGQMDQYASAYGGILHIDCTREPARVHRLKPKTELPLVIGDTKQEKDTPKILGWLGQRFRRKEPKFSEGIKNIVRTVHEARKELEKQSPSRHRIGKLMNENQHYLKDFLEVSGNCPVSPSRLDSLIDAALDAGALGAKLSGSGGGGCMIALCEPGEEAKVAKSITVAGGESYITKIADEGVRIEFIE